MQYQRLHPTALLREGCGAEREGRQGPDPRRSPPPALAQRVAATARAHTTVGDALWAGGAPVSRGCVQPRTSTAGRGNRPKREGELVRLRLPPHRPHVLSRGASARPPGLAPRPGLRADPPAGQLEDFAAHFPWRGSAGSGVPRGGSVPKAPCLTPRGKGAGWGQARKGGSQWLS